MSTKRRSWLKAGPLSLLLAASLASPVLGQSVTATVTGVVQDNQGGILKGAAVKAVNQNTGVETETRSNDAGIYTVTGLIIGNYTIKVEAAGFKTYVTNPFTLESNQIARINPKLELGAVTEELVVTDVNPILQSENAVVGEIITGNTASALPLNGRNFVSLTLLVPGSVTHNPESFLNPAGGQNGRPFVNGHREQSNNFMLDGLDMNESMENLVAYNPSPDALAEIRIETNNYSAEFGNVAGAVVNSVMKSGTNELHGSVFEFMRNDSFDANSWGNNKAQADKAELDQHIFGATLGGPLVKNKLFFFMDYQGTRIDQPGGGTIHTAPASWRDGSAFGLTPSQIHPVARTLLADTTNYPLPNRPDNIYAGTQMTETRNNQADLKLDANLGTNNNVFARFSYADYNTTQAERPIPVAIAVTNEKPSHSAAINWTRTFGSSIVNELRLGYAQVQLNETYDDWAGIGNYNTKIGIGGGQARPGLSSIDFGSIADCTKDCVGGIDGIGAAAPRSTATEKVFQLSEKVSISSGRHFFTGGAALLHYNNDRYYAGNSGELGGFTFASFKDFLLGNPGTQSRGFGAPWTHVQDRLGVFVQDDWKVRSNLTVNLGLRWEYMSPLVEKNNRQMNYDLGGIQSGRDLPKDGSKPPSATGQAIFYKTIPADAHCENIPAGCTTTDKRGLYDAYYGGISPRFGFAWTLNSKTIVRGAYGLVRYQEGTGGNNRLTQNSPFVPADLSGPWPAGRSLNQGFSEPLPGVGSGQIRYFADLVPQKTHQWNVFVERQLTGTMSLSAGYVGNRASNIMAFEFLNQSVPKPSLGEGNFNWDTPFAAVLPNVSFIRGTTSSGKSEYNGLQVALRQRRSKGLEFLASYTYGKALQDNNGFYGAGWSATSNYTEHTGNQIGVQDVRNPDADWGPAFYDIRHNVSLAANYELPVGRGKAWGGWNVSAVMSAHSGFPVTVREGSWWPLRSGTVPPGQERSDLVPGQTVTQKGDWSKPASDPGSRYLNINAFKQPAWGTYGNSPVGVGRGPGFFNVDMALEKDFTLGGTRALAFRLEAFNVLNHANKGMPNNDRLDAANFGTITYVENSPRILEFAVRFRF